MTGCWRSTSRIRSSAIISSASPANVFCRTSRVLKRLLSRAGSKIRTAISRAVAHRSCGLEQPHKCLQLSERQVRYRIIPDAIVAPAHELVAFRGNWHRSSFARSRVRNRRKADDVQLAAIRQRRDGSGANVFHACADQRESLPCKIDHAGRLGDAAVEPRLHGVAFGGLYVGRARDQAPDVVVNDRFSNAAACRLVQYEPRSSATDRQCDYRSSRQCVPRLAMLRALEPDGLEAEGSFYPRQQMRWHSLARQTVPQDLTQGLRASQLGGQYWISGDLPADRQRVGRIELTVHIGMNEQGSVIRGLRHTQVRHQWSVLIVSIKRRLVRANRDITVPMGMPMTSAISRYSSPWTSRRISTSRNSIGKAASAASSRTASTLAISADSGL